MNLVDEATFERKCGKMVPLMRNVSIFDGDHYKCACGESHIFTKGLTPVISEGMNGRFVVLCPNNPQLASLIKTKMKWGFIYKGLEFIVGCQIPR